jgi:hypothetical protein
MGPEARVCLVLWDRIKKMASEKKKKKTKGAKWGTKLRNPSQLNMN